MVKEKVVVEGEERNSRLELEKLLMAVASNSSSCKNRLKSFGLAWWGENILLSC